MALILSDNHLENLICSECGKYLSVLPVKVYRNGSVKCGRCSEVNDGGTVSLLERVIQNCLFKCVNRYEQCNKLLTLAEVPDHERKCFSGSYDCPKCDPTEFSGTAHEILTHYKNHHPGSILQENKFCIDINGTSASKERYLYIKDNIIFFILMENLDYGETLYLSVISLTPHKGIKQRFVLILISDTERCIKTAIKPCASLKTFKCDYYKIETGCRLLDQIQCEVFIDLPDGIGGAPEIPALFKEPEKVPVSSVNLQTLKSISGVVLTDQFKENFPRYRLTPCGTALFILGRGRIELVCSECKHFTGCNVYSCINGKHIMCWDCRTKLCKCPTTTGGWDADISSVNEKLMLPCRWKCGTTVSGGSLRTHEAQCVAKNYHCRPGRY